MEFKYAVALLKGDDEQIMGVFDTMEEADAFGFLELGFLRHFFLQEATMFDGQVPDGVVLTDQSNDLFQGRFFRVTVGVTME